MQKSPWIFMKNVQQNIPNMRWRSTYSFQKKYLFKTLNVPKPYVLPSRMRVAQVFRSKHRRTIHERSNHKSSKIHAPERLQQVWKCCPKSIPESCKNASKSCPKTIPKKGLQKTSIYEPVLARNGKRVCMVGYFVQKTSHHTESNTLRCDIDFTFWS